MLAKPVGGPSRTRWGRLVGEALGVVLLMRVFRGERGDRGLVPCAEKVAKDALPGRFAVSGGVQEIVDLIAELEERFGRRKGVGGRVRRWRRTNVEGLRNEPK